MKTDTSRSKPKSRPFLVLPLLSFRKHPDAMPKKPNLKLFTKRWPPKRDKDDSPRPLTATLDGPAVLDVSLVGVVDMSTVRKEFLHISDLCRFPISIAVKRKKSAAAGRPLSPPGKHKGRKSKKRPEAGTEDEGENGRSANKSVKKAVKKGGDANNNRTLKIPRKRVGNVAKLAEVDRGGAGKSTKLPEPCKTCGRPDQPERFHSHPETPVKPAKKAEEPPKMKSTVQKPFAMKYKSKQGDKRLPPPAQRKPSPPAQKLVHTPLNKGAQDAGTAPRVRSAKRTLTCYVCGREFGTASLSLHEPKCLQKWERENDSLPTHMQRKPPVKPDHPLTSDEWNKFAWESSQSTLTPCPKCGRTFYPDRLVVHQRSCKIVQDASKLSVDKPTSSPMPAPSTECYICGKMFGTHSIKIHEKQCLKKWQTENESLPADIRAREPVRKDPKARRSPEPSAAQEERPSSARKAPMFPCYICGRLFTANSIYIHEPQCLKMWKIENDKLPSNRRRPQPLKPDVKFTQEGRVDYGATNEANWKSHLSQLVPCRFCARTFNPERVDVHERSCKG